MFKKLPFIFFSILLFALVGCSEYQKVLKSTNLEYKYQKTVEYYEADEYYKALPLMEDLIPALRGSDKGESLYYMYAYANFYLDDYILASYQFKRFSTTYPISDKAEECNFMSAYCNYLMSPEPTLDQSNTYRALEELQTFVNRYPNSSLRDTCNELVDNLRFKLETKSYLKAKNYYKLRQYDAAIVSLNNTLTEYPDTDYREEVSFYILQSTYYLAVKSIEEKKLQRLNNTIEAYYNFIDNFAESEYAKEAEQLFANARDYKEEIESK